MEGAELAEGKIHPTDSAPVNPWAGLLQPQLSGQPSSLQEPKCEFSKKGLWRYMAWKSSACKYFNKSIVNTLKWFIEGNNADKSMQPNYWGHLNFTTHCFISSSLPSKAYRLINLVTNPLGKSCPLCLFTGMRCNQRDLSAAGLIISKY